MTQDYDDPHSGMHLCIRCETWQKRGSIHHCEATARYLKAKAENRIVYDEPEFIPVGGPNSVHLSTENVPESQRNPKKVDRPAAKVDKIPVPVLTPEKTRQIPVPVPASAQADKPWIAAGLSRSAYYRQRAKPEKGEK